MSIPSPGIAVKESVKMSGEPEVRMYCFGPILVTSAAKGVPIKIQKNKHNTTTADVFIVVSFSFM